MRASHWIPALALAITSASAAAQTRPGAGGENMRDGISNTNAGWQFGLGAGLIAAPRSVGSERTRVLVVPIPEARYQDWLFIDPIRGLGVQAQPAGGLSVSAAVGVSLDSRRAKDESRYTGLGDIKEAPALILGLDYRVGAAFLGSRVRSRLGSDNGRGSTADIDLGYNAITSRAAVLGVGVTARAMDGTYARNFFGVNAAQAAASGLQRFSAGSGLQRAGLFAQAFYRISDDWSMFGRLEATQFSGDAGSSPLVVQKRQTSFIVSARRTF
jgi:MipA family protein